MTRTEFRLLSVYIFCPLQSFKLGHSDFSEANGQKLLLVQLVSTRSNYFSGIGTIIDFNDRLIGAHVSLKTGAIVCFVRLRCCFSLTKQPLHTISTTKSNLHHILNFSENILFHRMDLLNPRGEKATTFPIAAPRKYIRCVFSGLHCNVLQSVLHMPDVSYLQSFYSIFCKKNPCYGKKCSIKRMLIVIYVVALLWQ